MKLFSVPYRWLPRTFFLNIRWALWDIWTGIKNIIRWTPVVWSDRDDDWAYLAEIMEYKLRRMSKLFKTGHHALHERDARRTLVCAELLKRLRTESYLDRNIGPPMNKYTLKRDVELGNYYQKYAGEIIGKYLRGWWD